MAGSYHRWLVQTANQATRSADWSSTVRMRDLPDRVLRALEKRSWNRAACDIIKTTIKSSRRLCNRTQSLRVWLHEDSGVVATGQTYHDFSGISIHKSKLYRFVDGHYRRLVRNPAGSLRCGAGSNKGRVQALES